MLIGGKIIITRGITYTETYKRFEEGELRREEQKPINKYTILQIIIGIIIAVVLIIYT